jgi:hypothetical protein
MSVDYDELSAASRTIIFVAAMNLLNEARNVQ